MITHGTDTVIETARNFADIKNKAIILTGAMRPERFSSSDADFNVGVAVGAINMVEEGIFIAMNGMVCSYNRVRRDLTTGQFVEAQTTVDPDMV
jgi:L-asparaginase